LFARTIRTHASTLRDLSELAPEALPQGPRELAVFWLANRRGRTAPERTDFDPVAMPRSLLPFLVIWDVSAEDFYVRLAGTEVCLAAGGELRGKALSRTREIDGDSVLQEFDAVAGGTHYSYAERTMAWTKRENLLCQRLLLPVSVTDGRAAHLIGAFAFPKRFPVVPGDAGNDPHLLT
jgi:hypothetical protein